MATNSLRHTPLFDLIIASKARMTEFSGWEMAVQFTSLKEEHFAVRKNAGIFDISHMGKFSLQGKNLVTELQELVPTDLAKLKSGTAIYTVLLNEQAGIIDDIIFYYEGETENQEQKGFIIVNAATKDKDRDWFLSHLSDNITFKDHTDEQVLIAIQGPLAIKYLQPFITDDLTSLKNFGHFTTTIFDTPAFIARTGYTGEDGFEVMVTPEIGQKLWSSLVDSGVTPCGLGARDTLRLEAAMSLYGQDINDTTTPLEAGLNWLVNLDSKGDFIGRNVLEQQNINGLSRRLVGLEMQSRHIARHDYPVIYQGEKVGIVTSGTLSPTLEKPISLAYIPQNLSKIGTVLEVEIRGKNYPAKVVKKPFYRSPNR
jgi:aminomethyltransferase